MTIFTLENLAVLFTIICIFLAGRNSVHTWWTGIVACITYGVVFYDAKLYADMILQVFFVATSLIGWWTWGKKIDDEITFSTPKQLVWMIFGGAIVTCVYGYILHTYTDAYAPWVDSLVLSLSVIGQFLLMRRKVENWVFWIFVNIISVPLYYSRELYVTSALYVVFLAHAVYAYANWMSISNEVEYEEVQ